MKRLMAAAALVLAPLCAADMAFAQIYPARSIQVIVPFAGGSASDSGGASDPSVTSVGSVTAAAKALPAWPGALRCAPASS